MASCVAPNFDRSSQRGAVPGVFAHDAIAHPRTQAGERGGIDSNSRQYGQDGRNATQSLAGPDGIDVHRKAPTRVSSVAVTPACRAPMGRVPAGEADQVGRARIPTVGTSLVPDQLELPR